MLKMHSGGKVTEALLMAMVRDALSTSPTQRESKNLLETSPAIQTSKIEATVASDDETPSTRRRRKRDKDVVSDPKIDLFPKPERKGLFCCFC
jgi:hypothetical protein